MSQRQCFRACWAPEREEASFRRRGNLITGSPGLGREGNKPAPAACGHRAGGEKARPVDSRAGIRQCGLQLVFVAPTPLSPPMSCAPPAKEGGAWLHMTQRERLVRKGRVGARQRLRHHAATRMGLWNK